MNPGLLTHKVMLCLLLMTGPVRAEALPDPTRPAEYRSAMPVAQDVPRELIEWKLTAIRITGTDRTAIVNGKIVREGDTLGSARVLEIQPISVLLSHENKQVSIRLYTDLVQKKFRENE